MSISHFAKKKIEMHVEWWLEKMWSSIDSTYVTRYRNDGIPSTKLTGFNSFQPQNEFQPLLEQHYYLGEFCIADDEKINCARDRQREIIIIIIIQQCQKIILLSFAVAAVAAVAVVRCRWQCASMMAVLPNHLSFYWLCWFEIYMCRAYILQLHFNKYLPRDKVNV